MQVSLLKIYISLYVVEYAIQTFDQVKMQMPTGFYNYFNLHPQPLSEHHKRALQAHNYACEKAGTLKEIFCLLNFFF